MLSFYDKISFLKVCGDVPQIAIRNGPDEQILNEKVFDAYTKDASVDVICCRLLVNQFFFMPYLMTSRIRENSIRE